MLRQAYEEKRTVLVIYLRQVSCYKTELPFIKGLSWYDHGLSYNSGFYSPIEEIPSIDLAGIKNVYGPCPHDIYYKIWCYGYFINETVLFYEAASSAELTKLDDGE